MKKPLRHWVGNHDHCPPRLCDRAARLCNEEESRIRMEDYIAERNGTACPNCGSGHTFPAPDTYDERFCGECEHTWQMFDDDEEWWP